MLKKNLILFGLAVIAPFGLVNAAEDYPSAPNTPAAQKPLTLAPNRIENIYSTVGVVTSLEFLTEKEIQQIKLGSPIAEVSFDPERRIIDIFPKVEEGRTNMNVVIDNCTYVFVLTVSLDGQVDYRRTYTLVGETASQDAEVLQTAPRLKPSEIDVVGAINTIEDARTDPIYRAQLPMYRMLPLNKTYQWNGNLVHLLEAHQFLRKDLTVLKVQWLNEQDKAYYLKDRQYQVWVANKQIPVTASMQATDGTVFPGQLETVWLFIQGYRLSINNPWEIKLPPEASSIRKLLR